MPQSMHRAACSTSSSSGTGSSNSFQSLSLSATGLLCCSLRSISIKPRTLPMDSRLLPGAYGNVPACRNIARGRRQGRKAHPVRGWRFLGFEGTPVLARHDLHELGDDRFPGVEQLGCLAAPRSLHVLFEVAADDVGVGRADGFE